MFRACRIAVALLVGWVLWTPQSTQAQQIPIYQAPAFQAPAFAGGPNFGLPQSAGRQPVFRGAYLRAEYLDWNIEAPGDVLLGSEIAGVPDPSALFPVTDAFGNVVGAATVSTTRPLSLEGNNGFRGTIGLEFFNGGTIEFGGFVLTKAESELGEFGLLNRVISFVPPPTPTVPNPALVTVPRLVATSTLVNGQVGNNIETYNNSFEANYSSQLASGEASVIFDYYEGPVFSIKGLAGFRFIRLQESLEQTGVFTDTILNQDLVSEIDSFTNNDLIGSMAGIRAEATFWRVTLGVQPRFGLAANAVEATVRTNNFRSLADGEHIFHTRDTVVSPMFDLGVYARLAVRRNLSVTVGYNFLWLGQVTRPEDNVVYNDRGPFPTPPDIHLDMRKHVIRVDGVSIGGELRF